MQVFFWPKTYFSILKEISNGKHALNEISNAIGAERTALVRYIGTLIELDLIEATRPVTAKEKSRNTFYVLKDNYFKVWFKFIYPFKKDLGSFLIASFQKNFEQNFNSFVGKQFEQICKEAIMAKNPVASAKVGGWWGHYRENNERKTIEIDIVSINEEKKEILFWECKWLEKIAPNGILKSLKKKAAFVQWNNESRKEHFVIFAKSFKEKKNN